MATMQQTRPETRPEYREEYKPHEERYGAWPTIVAGILSAVAGVAGIINGIVYSPRALL